MFCSLFFKTNIIHAYIIWIVLYFQIRKQQQRVLFILSSLKIEFEVIDITEMGKENEREFMRTQCKLHNKENPLPPQIFNDETYCGVRFFYLFLY